MEGRIDERGLVGKNQGVRNRSEVERGKIRGKGE